MKLFGFRFLFDSKAEPELSGETSLSAFLEMMQSFRLPLFPTFISLFTKRSFKLEKSTLNDRNPIDFHSWKLVIGRDVKDLHARVDGRQHDLVPDHYIVAV